MYNIEVETEHCYYVSPSAVLSHNTNPCSLPSFTRDFLARSKVIARGSRIRDVDRLVSEYGGRRSNWAKKKSWDDFGQEWHWYEHHGIGRLEVTPK